MLISSALTVAALALSGGDVLHGAAPDADPYVPVGAIVSGTAPGAPIQRASSPDSADIRRRARRLQSRFESNRVRHLPRSLGGSRPQCDDIIGRMCIWDDGDNGWTPRDEPEEIVVLRTELLAALDSLAREIPGDHWLFGQRIRYLVEAGRLGEAASLARWCGLPARWRCDAYMGYVRHHQKNIRGAEQAFRRALDAMPPHIFADWTDPKPLLDRDLRRWLADQADSAAAMDRLWMLSDPLFLAPGNDRWTGHMSRWSYSMSSEEARNPYQLIWGDDLTRVTVRYGWPVAWERSWSTGGGRAFSVSGHDYPGEFRAFPPQQVLGWGRERVEPVFWEIPDGHARSKYVPPYLDSLGVLEGQIGRFWRRNGVLVVGVWEPPRVEPVDAAPDAPGDPAEIRNRIIASEVRKPVPDVPAAAPLRVGLFVEQDGALEVDVRTTVLSGGAVRLSALAPWANWGVVSLEAWSPETRRAWRLRAGMGFRHIMPDLFTLSDLLLLEVGAEPAGPEEVAEVLRTATGVAGDEPLTLAFEVYGLLSPSELVDFRAWVEKSDEGFFTRAVRWLGFGGGKEQVMVGWEEGGPERRGPLFRTFSIGLPDLEPGGYEVVIEVTARGHSPLEARRAFTVR
ncbi:MAG: hypothetical protein OXL34_00445 [Gemmatimonadota bacterium]|nr:hypothetical protein [Gemmatimonadota bacterium]